MFPTDSSFDMEVILENQSEMTSEEMPLRILFLGDWSGRESRAAFVKPPKFKAFEIDRDNFETIMQKFSVNLLLNFESVEKNSLSLEFSEIDDFHPDRIFQTVPIFAKLRDIRRKLLSSNTFDEAAAEINSWLTSSKTVSTIEPELPEVVVNKQSSENLLDEILGSAFEKDSVSVGQTIPKSELSEFISQIIKPHVVQTDTIEQSKLLLIVDEVISDLMRKILHHPQFQALESAWRGLYFFVRRVETDSALKIYLMDVTKEELSVDVKNANDLTDSLFFDLIETGISGNYSDNEPWAIIGGNYTFTIDVSDAALLMRIAKIAENFNVPFISHISQDAVKFLLHNCLKDFNDKDLSDNSSTDKLWTAVRSGCGADYLGLVSPRFLARLPYGEQTDPIEAFFFEELLNFEQPNNYLWSNPSFACILMIVQTFTQSGLDISANFISEIENMPIHFYQEDNETKNIACTEISLKERDCLQLLNDGIMPLISFRSSDRIRLARLQSIAKPISALNGRWN